MFLGWEQPALPAAAAHLIEHYIDGAVADLRPATIVLPGRRARRRVIELLLDDGITYVIDDTPSLRDLDLLLPQTYEEQQHQ